MDYGIGIVLVLAIVNLYLFIKVIKKLDVMHAYIESVLQTYEFDEEGDIDNEVFETETKKELEEYTENIEKRDKEFDERIEQIKSELDKEQQGGRRGTDADILHPGVENLPHDSVNDYTRNPPDVEYTE